MKNTRVVGVVIASLLFGLASVAPAMAIVTVPTGLSPGDDYRLAFVTSTTRDATSTSIDDYNAFVQGVVDALGAGNELYDLGTTWTAIGSTVDDDARDNTGTNPSSPGVPIYRLDDTRIADNNRDLWDGSIANPIIVNENGDSIDLFTWTGSEVHGVSSPQSALGDQASVMGLTSDPLLGTWMYWDTFPSTFSRNLYAMSDVLTAPVPVPAAFCLFGTAIAGLLGVGWRRRSAST